MGSTITAGGMDSNSDSVTSVSGISKNKHAKVHAAFTDTLASEKEPERVEHNEVTIKVRVVLDQFIIKGLAGRRMLAHARHVLCW